jgi:hypothetical protein
MLLIITIVLKVTWQGKTQRNFKTWRSKHWKKILRWSNSSWHDYVFVDLTRSPQCFLWKMGSSCKSYVRNINVNLYYKHFQFTGSYDTSVNTQWANFKMSHKSLFGQNHGPNHTKPTNILLRKTKSSLKAGGTHRKHLANNQLHAQIFNTFITALYVYMFRTISCSSSGGQIVLIQHLVSSLSVSDRPVHRLRKPMTNLMHKF